jgi:hypothetical protein
MKIIDSPPAAAAEFIPGQVYLYRGQRNAPRFCTARPNGEKGVVLWDMESGELANTFPDSVLDSTRSDFYTPVVAELVLR